MTPRTPTQTITGYLGRDVEVRLTTPRDYQRTYYDPIVDEELILEGTTTAREFARLSIAIHSGSGSRRTTEWIQLRAWNLDDHPDEARLRTARRGQRVEVEGFWESHLYTDRTTAELRTFRYLVVTGFRHRPGSLLTLRPGALTA